MKKQEASGTSDAVTHSHSNAPTHSLAVPPGNPSREPDLDSIRDAVAADIWARYHRSCGHSVQLVLVVADHAAEVEDAAAVRRIAPQELADQWAAGWQARLDAIGVSCDGFVRTSETRHQRVAKALFLKLLDQEDIGVFDGGLPPIENAPAGGAGVPPASRQDACSTRRYALRVSKYEKALTQYLDDHADFIRPAECRDAVIRSARGHDPWVSRERREWGIPVPGDRGHAIEGWFDGLVGHLTASDYLTDPQAFERGWPPKVQIAAPGRLETHGAAPLALWMAMGLPFPERLIVRGRLRWEDAPLGSERGALGGWAAGPGAEPLRYAVARAADFVADASLSPSGIAACWNTEIVGRLLRLVETIRAAVEGACGGQVPRPGPFGPAEGALAEASTGLFAKIGPLIESLDLRAALEAVLTLVAKTSKYAVEHGVGCSPREAPAAPLYVLLEVCRLVAQGLRPFLPTVASAICGRLGIADDEGPSSSHAQWGLTRPRTRLPQGEPLESQFRRSCTSLDF